MGALRLVHRRWYWGNWVWWNWFVRNTFAKKQTLMINHRFISIFYIPNLIFVLFFFLVTPCVKIFIHKLVSRFLPIQHFLLLIFFFINYFSLIFLNIFSLHNLNRPYNQLILKTYFFQLLLRNWQRKRLSIFLFCLLTGLDIQLKGVYIFFVKTARKCQV